MGYEEELSAKIVSTGEFRLTPGNSPRVIVFLESEGGIYPKTIVDRWQLSYQEAKQSYALLMFKDSALFCTLTLSKNGEWSGRSRDSRGIVNLVPMPLGSGGNGWNHLTDAGMYWRSIKPDSSHPEFSYLEPLPRQVDWSKYYVNLGNPLTVANRPVGENEAGIIIGYDRPDYFQQVCATIAQNPESQQIKWYIFLDHHHNRSLTDRQANMACDTFKNCTVIPRPRNFGCGRNIIDARHQLFDNLGYELVWVFEDDLVVAPDYMATVKKLFNWGRKNYSNIGAAQGWRHCTLSQEEKTKNKHLTVSTYENWWGYLMCREAWQAMMPFIFKYQSLFLGGEYWERPHRSAVAWFRENQRPAAVVRGTSPYPESEWSKKLKREYFNSPPSGQDAATMVAFERQGFCRLAPQVNKARYIGRNGIHMRQSLWDKMGFDKVLLDSVKLDKEFEPCLV